jgi:hypothetical protein
MDGFTHLGWGSYVGAALLAVGLVLAKRGVRSCYVAFPRPGTASMHPLTWMRGFRLTLFGLAVAGAGAAWLWQVEWLLLLSLAIGGEETLETSICISALRTQQRRAERNLATYSRSTLTALPAAVRSAR